MLKGTIMILLEQNSQEFNNDIRAMIMAFYPGVKITDKPDDCQEYMFLFKAQYRDAESEFSIMVAPNNNPVTPQGIYNGEYSVTSRVVKGDYRDKAEFRNRLKLVVYNLLCNHTGHKLPWGDLTGVRPTKIAMAKLNQGCCFDRAVNNYMDTYDVSEKKAYLATKVAQKEISIISDIDPDKDYCLYVGIPFCPSRCLYCSFTSYPIATYKEKSQQYIDKLKKELEYIADAYKHKKLVAIYFGGGTPTSITHEQMEELFSKIQEVFDLSHLKEYTVEAGRPDSITEDKLRVMKGYGITRISINPQTMNDDTLRTIGRAHTAAQAKEAFLLARKEGFDNINMDLIAGLPGENLSSMRHTLEEVKALSPESITVHSLAIKRAANLKQQMEQFGDTINHDMDDMLDMVSDTASELDMEPYYLYRQKNIGGNLENVGYSKNGLECLYNILIMEEITDIIAAGAGASTKLTYHAENRVERVENCKSVDDYIDRFDEMLERKKKAFLQTEI